VPHDLRASAVIRAASAEALAALEAGKAIFPALTRCEVELGQSVERPAHAAASVVNGSELFIRLEGLISFEKEKIRMQKEITKVTAYIDSLNKKLSNQGFVAKAPAEVIAKEQEKLEEAKALAVKLQENLEVLS